MDDADAAGRADVVRRLVEECWTDEAGLARMADLVAPGYVHHTPWGDLDFEQFKAGLAYVDTIFGDRGYEVMHVVDDGTMVAAFLSWSGTRRADGSPVTGRGAYHCRLDDGRIAEDWDAFFPSS